MFPARIHFPSTLLCGTLCFNLLSKTVNCVRVGVSVVGLEVPHAHLHLIPFMSEQDMSFSNKRIKMTNEEFLDLQSRIIKNLN